MSINITTNSGKRICILKERSGESYCNVTLVDFLGITSDEMPEISKCSEYRSGVFSKAKGLFSLDLESLTFDSGVYSCPCPVA